jgi:hypothetical protein
VTSQEKDQRLLWDCATVARFLEAEHPAAQSRLNTKLGEHLTQILISTLRNTEPAIPHSRAHGQPRAG